MHDLFVGDVPDADGAAAVADGQRLHVGAEGQAEHRIVGGSGELSARRAADGVP